MQTVVEELWPLQMFLMALQMQGSELLRPTRRQASPKLKKFKDSAQGNR